MESGITKIIIDYYSNKDYAQLSDKAFDIIVELIVMMELKPGMLYSESEIIEIIGIGRTPVREAIKKLAYMNIVRVLPRSGIIIADLCSDDVELERAVRISIEELIIKKTAMGAFPHERQYLRDLINIHADCFNNRDFIGVVRSDLQFHTALAVFSRNDYAMNAVWPFTILE